MYFFYIGMTFDKLAKCIKIARHAIFLQYTAKYNSLIKISKLNGKRQKD